MLGAVPAAAGPTSGSTVLLGPAVGGEEVVVRATIGGVYPVVSYDFALLNQCWFKGRFSGTGLQRDLPAARPVVRRRRRCGHSEETVNLNSVPSGAVCKVSVSRTGPR